MRIIYLLFIALIGHSQTLSSLIDTAQKNERVESSLYQVNAAQLGYEGLKRSYLPRIDGYGSAAFVDHTGGFDAKESYNGGLRASVVVFDGFKRENLLDQNKALEKAAHSNLAALKKEISLNVIQRYYELQNILDSIQTYSAMRDQLEAQYLRLEKFQSVGLASEDMLMRMRSEVEEVKYTIEDLNYQADRQKSDLETLSNQTITAIESGDVKEPQELRPQELDTLQALRYSRDAALHEAEQQDASDLPTIMLEDQYNVSHYENDPIEQMRVPNQNKFTASLNMNLFDFSAASTAKQAKMAQAHAKSSELAYATKEMNHNLELAKRYIERSQVLISTSQSAYDASKKTFEAVKKKYEARIVDYVTYLDAIRTFADATNQLHRAKRTLHYAYAAYYYYAGYDPKEFIQ